MVGKYISLYLFFLGTYLRDYVYFRKVKPVKALVTFILIVFVPTAYNIIRAGLGNFRFEA